MFFVIAQLFSVFSSGSTEIYQKMWSGHVSTSEWDTSQTVHLCKVMVVCFLSWVNHVRRTRLFVPRQCYWLYSQRVVEYENTAFLAHAVRSNLSKVLSKLLLHSKINKTIRTTLNKTKIDTICSLLLLDQVHGDDLNFNKSTNQRPFLSL